MAGGGACGCYCLVERHFISLAIVREYRGNVHSRWGGGTTTDPPAGTALRAPCPGPGSDTGLAGLRGGGRYGTHTLPRVREGDMGRAL